MEPKRMLFAILVVIITSPAVSQEITYPYMKQINKEQYNKTAEKIAKVLQKKSNSENNYAAFKLYSSEKFERYNNEKAYLFLLQAIIKIDDLDEKGYQKLSKNGLTKEQLNSDLFLTTEKGLKIAKKEPSIEKYNHFLEFYTKATSSQQNDAILCRNAIAYNNAKSDNSLSAYQNFIKNYPDALEINDAWQKIYEIEYKTAENENTEKTYRHYASKYPKSPFSAKAIEKANNFQFFNETSENDWYSYRRYINNHREQKKQIEIAKKKIWEIYKKTYDIEILKYCAKNANHPELDWALLILHDLYMNEDIDNFNSFYDEYDNACISRLKEHDRKAVDALNTISADSYESVINFIRKAAPYKQSYDILLLLMKEDIDEKKWSSALETARMFETEFGNDKNYKSLIKTLSAEDETGINVTPFSTAINTKEGDEYGIAVSADGKTIYFCGRYRKDNVGGEDIFYSQKTKYGWSKAKEISDLNTSYGNEAPLNISTDGTKMIMFKSGQLCESDKTTKGWSYPYPFPDNINISDWQADAMITSDGKAMIFAAIKKTNYELGEKSEDVYEKTNIYVSELDENGYWGVPTDLGPTINTPYCDRSPFLHSDMKTLYFCSKGHGTLGELDVFKSTRLSEDSWTEWSEPENIGKEINTTGIDCWYKISTDGKTAYFSKIDKDGKGDLYCLNLPKHMRPNMVATISGHLKDKNQKPIDAEIHWEDLETGNQIGQSKTDPADGSFFIVLPLGKIYGYYIDDNKYFPISNNIDLRESEQAMSIDKEIEIVSFKQMIDDGMAVPINNLFFNIAEDELLPYSLPELKRVANIIIKNNLKVEISGHADNTGDADKNQVLSERRASAVKNYLVENGCDANLISTIGYGSTKPVASNNTTEGRQQNRRVELKFVK